MNFTLESISISVENTVHLIPTGNGQDILIRCFESCTRHDTHAAERFDCFTFRIDLSNIGQVFDLLNDLGKGSFIVIQETALGRSGSIAGLCNALMGNGLNGVIYKHHGQTALCDLQQTLGG